MAPNLSNIWRYIGPSVNMERGFVSKSGAGDAEFIFLRLKSLGMFVWNL
jgi:hypothetical protein